VDVLWGDETLFRNEEVFDPDYQPPAIFHRDSQIRDLAAFLRPAVRGRSPGHALCVGPPSTGKTTVVRHVLEKVSKHDVAVAYLRCPILRTTYNVFARIYEIACERLPPQKGVPLFKLLSEVSASLDGPIVVALDDVDFLDTRVLNETLLTLSKNAEFCVGVIAISTSKQFLARVDPYLGSILHFHEIGFPMYTREEIWRILHWRVVNGFYPGAVTREAFERVVEIVSRSGDVRYGLHLLRSAGIYAERRASRRVELCDVERAREGQESIMLAKSLSALNSDEREALRIIYSLEGDVTTGEVFAIMRSEVGLCYERFYEIVEKLERLRFIDLVFGRKGRGRTRYVIKRLERDAVLRALTS